MNRSYSAAKVFLFLLMLMPPAARAEIKLSFETTDLVPAGSRKVAEETLQAAVRVVRGLPPKKDNPFRARTDREVHLVLSTSRDPIAQQAQSGESSDGDAFTTTAEVNGRLVTFVYLLTDRLFWDESGKQRPDAYLRLLLALGHEIYGNVPDQLKLKLGKPPKVTEESSDQDEIRNFKAGIAFLDRLAQSKNAAGVKPQLIDEARKREQTTLKNWTDDLASCSRTDALLSHK